MVMVTVTPPETVLQVTGAFASEAVLPETLNLKRHPADDEYCRSAPEPADSAKDTVPLLFWGDCPVQVVTWLPVPLQVAPWKLARFLVPLPPPLLLLPPQAHASPRTSPIHARFI